ncbi:MAG: glycosyltransferase [Deltaproteobacteria bacterium]|nr:glycosyltransferase [Deltaproteobacteria bacterium]
MYTLCSIVLPICNQADHIRTVVNEYAEKLAELTVPYEIILVVNGCRDNSEALCRDLAERRENVRLIVSRTGGWGLAVKLGMSSAGGNLLCFTNSARTTADDLLFSIQFALDNPGIVVKANRKIRETALRRLGSILYNIQCRMLFDIPVWDINGTPKLFPRDFKHLLTLSEDGDLFDMEFIFRCTMNGYRIVEFPINLTPRHGGKSTTGILSALRMYGGAFGFYLNSPGGRK